MSIARDVGISYSGLRKWVKDDDRSIGDKTLDRIADVLGKKIILIDKDV